jgi:hypothetical protein
MDSIGKISQELKVKKAPTRDPIELQREMQKKYEKNIYNCVKRGKKALESDFYIVVITKKERLMDNVLRNYFFFRKSCPTPEWDQVVYHYHPGPEKLEFLWVVPSNYTCGVFKDNIMDISKEEKPLLKFILDYEDGTLFRLSKKLNGEEADTPTLKT